MKLAVINDDGEVVDTYDLETDDADEATKSLESFGPYDSVASFNPEIWRWMRKTIKKACENVLTEEECRSCGQPQMDCDCDDAPSDAAGQEIRDASDDVAPRRES